MTVKELIKQLKNLPEDFTVHATTDGVEARPVSGCFINLVNASGGIIQPDNDSTDGYTDAIVIECSPR